MTKDMAKNIAKDMAKNMYAIAISQNFAKLTFARVKKMDSVRLRIFYDFAHPFERKYYIYELYIPIEVHSLYIPTYIYIGMFCYGH